jgi:hypothetical protein
MTCSPQIPQFSIQPPVYQPHARHLTRWPFSRMRRKIPDRACPNGALRQLRHPGSLRPGENKHRPRTGRPQHSPEPSFPPLSGGSIPGRDEKSRTPHGEALWIKSRYMWRGARCAEKRAGARRPMIAAAYPIFCSSIEISAWSSIGLTPIVPPPCCRRACIVAIISGSASPKVPPP